MNLPVTVRLYAAARSAAGVSEVEVTPDNLGHILLSLAFGNPRLSQVFAQCSFLIDGVAVHDKQVEVAAGSTVDILPPFAGG